MNYSSHLSSDETELFSDVYRKFCSESKTILIALNRIDEMYAAEVVKSYERAADYVRSRLEALKYDNVLIVPVSALTGIYTAKLQKTAEGENESAAIFLSEKMRERRRIYGHVVSRIHQLYDMSRIQYLMHLLENTN